MPWLWLTVYICIQSTGLGEHGVNTKNTFNITNKQSWEYIYIENRHDRKGRKHDTRQPPSNSRWCAATEQTATPLSLYLYLYNVGRGAQGKGAVKPSPLHDHTVRAQTKKSLDNSWMVVRPSKKTIIVILLTNGMRNEGRAAQTFPISSAVSAVHISMHAYLKLTSLHYFIFFSSAARLRFYPKIKIPAYPRPPNWVWLWVSHLFSSIENTEHTSFYIVFIMTSRARSIGSTKAGILLAESQRARSSGSSTGCNTGGGPAAARS